jgi:hypothetical protein
VLLENPFVIISICMGEPFVYYSKAQMVIEFILPFCKFKLFFLHFFPPIISCKNVGRLGLYTSHPSLVPTLVGPMLSNDPLRAIVCHGKVLDFHQAVVCGFES